MLIGEFIHNIDAKKRLAVPAKFRRELGERAVLTRGLDNCLFLFPLKEWQIFAEKLSKLPVGQQNSRSFIRIMLAGATDVELDGLGRILIPDYLKNYAGLKKKVVIAGLFTRCEIWDEENWREYQKNAEKSSGDIAEKLGELGI
jgi:MraZ protein